MEIKVGKTYKLIEKINCCAFGEYFKVINENFLIIYVSVKMNHQFFVSLTT
jgi:hypothetical protein